WPGSDQEYIEELFGSLPTAVCDVLGRAVNEPLPPRVRWPAGARPIGRSTERGANPGTGRATAGSDARSASRDMSTLGGENSPGPEPFASTMETRRGGAME